MLWILNQSKALTSCGRQFTYCRRMKRFNIGATQRERADPFGVKRLPAHGELWLLCVIRGVRRLRAWSCRAVLAVPFLALGDVELEAVRTREVPRRAGDRNPHFLVGCPNISVHPC